jgi:uncharacterized protein YlxW (UPF0749 family)
VSGSQAPHRFGIRTWALSLGLALAVVGFVGAAQWNSSIERQAFTTSAQQVLTSRVVDLEDEREALRAQIEEEEARLAVFQEQDTGSRAVLDRLNTDVSAARLAAGLTDVIGPGVIIEIDDSRLVIPPDQPQANYFVQADDLQDIIAALWAAGAEAIAINDERLVATTSIYGAGATILLNTRLHPPPYRFEAIGPEGLNDRFLAHPTFRGGVGQRIDAYGLEFASEPADELTLPAFVGNTAFRWGVPVEDE